MSAEQDAVQREALDLFSEWLDLPPTTRDADLERQLVDRPTLLATVRRLIGTEAHRPMLPTEPPAPVDKVFAQPPPDRVGVYRLTEPIGHGGMGLVFRGERDDGVFTQTVAIKLIRRSLFSGTAAAQFASERQILARLRHPHIAQLFDGGVTTSGESYIVMELIEGRSITAHCDALNLDARQRMTLLRDVCDAMQFAHQHLIVHADIKPNNVVIDDRYGVKLLDFGIARMIDLSLTESRDEPLPTTARAQTPAFASPQQAAGLQATPADDVFSLGRMAATLLDDGTPLPAELAAVVARATAVDPAERYGTASALSGDLERWLNGRPVSALRSTPSRTAAMFVRRNWLGVGIAALALLSLIAAVAVTTTLYVRAEHERRLAEQRFAEVRQLASYLLTDVTGQLQHFPGTSQLRNDLARRGRTYLETLSRVKGAPLDMRLEVARGYATTAQILGQPSVQNLGNPRAAKRDLIRAETGMRTMLAETGDRPDIMLALSQALSTHAAIVHVTDNNPALGEQLFKQACVLAGRAVARLPRDPAARLARIRCSSGLANLYDYQARFADMERPLAVSFADLRTMPSGADPVETALALGNAYILRGDAKYYLGAKLASLPEYRAADLALRQPANANPDVRLLERLAWADYSIGSLLDDLNRPVEGLPAIERGIVAADLMLAFEKSPRARHIDNILHMQRAATLASLHRYPEAIAEAEAASQSYRQVAAAAPDDFEAARSIPVSMRPLGEIYYADGQRARACAIFTQASMLWGQLARRHGVLGFDTADELKIVKSRLDVCRRAGFGNKPV
ncbi:serine/threonine protein kinase [Sphingosinicellaceae bacterium]|nr:serine/threonine protein kinase [Sphingosinicellaceae bacterium]